MLDLLELVLDIILEVVYYRFKYFIIGVFVLLLTIWLINYFL